MQTLAIIVEADEHGPLARVETHDGGGNCAIDSWRLVQMLAAASVTIARLVVHLDKQAAESGVMEPGVVTRAYNDVVIAGARGGLGILEGSTALLDRS